MTSPHSAVDLLHELGARRGEPLNRCTFVQVGGPAEWFLGVDRREALVEAVRAARRSQIALTVLGAGSNVLIRDGGLRGLVIKNDTRGCRQIDETLIEVDPGVRFAALARSTARAGLSGLEWAAGIPGAIGGGLPTNAGAYGSELCDVLVSVQAIDRAGEAVTLDAADLGLSYRDSRVRSGDLQGCVVTALTLQLERGDVAASEREIDRVESLRKANAPVGPSLGSTFRNPSVGPPAGERIEQAGLKGERIGAAQVSERHANYIQNVDVPNARAADFLALIARVQDRVASHSGVRLEPEIAVIGEESSNG